MRFADLADLIARECGNPTLSQRICAAICKEANGETVYIPSRPVLPVVVSSDTPATVVKKYQVSRPTAYRWVHRWKL